MAYLNKRNEKALAEVNKIISKLKRDLEFLTKMDTKDKSINYHISFSLPHENDHASSFNSEMKPVLDNLEPCIRLGVAHNMNCLRSELKALCENNQDILFDKGDSIIVNMARDVHSMLVASAGNMSIRDIGKQRGWEEAIMNRLY